MATAGDTVLRALFRWFASMVRNPRTGGVRAVVGEEIRVLPSVSSPSSTKSVASVAAHARIYVRHVPSVLFTLKVIKFTKRFNYG